MMNTSDPLHRMAATRYVPGTLWLPRTLCIAAALTGVAGLFALPARSAEPATAAKPFGIDHLAPLTASRVVGSPDPPLPFRVKRTFANLKTSFPLIVMPEPGSDRLIAILHGG